MQSTAYASKGSLLPHVPSVAGKWRNSPANLSSTTLLAQHRPRAAHNVRLHRSTRFYLDLTLLR